MEESELTRHGSPVHGFEPLEEDEAAEAEIEAMFKRRLMGLRRLPRYQRAGALRAAREWRQLALKALRERRATDRHARHMLWRLGLPAPRQPG
jgi:hypothetical protein